MNVNFRTDGVAFKNPESWTGWTSSKHLAKIRMTEPQFGSKIMTYIGSSNTRSMAMEEYLKLIDVTKYRDTSAPVSYMIYGEGRKYATLIKVIADDMNRVGYNKGHFTMVFDAPFFSETHVIVGMSDKYLVRILGDGEQDFGGWAYECSTVGSANHFIPITELKTGSTWTKEGAPVPLYNSEKGAKASYSSPYAITYNWSSVSMEDSIPGDMVHQPLAFGWIGEDGKPKWTWEDKRTFTFDLEFRQLKNNTIIWGRDNMNEAGGYDDIDERSGVEIISGAGINEQLERGNVYYYNSFDIEEFGDKIVQLRLGKTQADTMHFLITTGTMGMQQAHKDIARKASEWEKVDSGSIFGDRLNMGFGNRFTRYIHPAGITLDFRLEPMFDDIYRTPVRHPDGGFARSYEYHVTDLGTTQGETSIELNYVKGAADIMGIKKGLRNPFTPFAAQSVDEVASLKDAWEERRMSQFMVVLTNPKNGMIYRPNILR